MTATQNTRQHDLSKLEINFLEAEQFLTILDEDCNDFTFFTIEEPKPELPAKPNLYHGTFEQHKEQLVAANQAGHGIFFTVNRTDGKGRKAPNIRSIRALFIDLDGAPLDPVHSAPLPPHIVIETSLQRYHAYWLIEEVPCEEFSELQKHLAQRFNSDSAVCDLPRLMRLPGFFHLKDQPFRSHFIENSGAQSYQLADFKQAFEIKPQVSSKQQVHITTPPDALHHLKEKGMVIRCENNESGRWLIRCPWGNQHSDKNTTAYYFESKNKEYAGEGFHCFHQHCSGRNIHDLCEYLGLPARAFGDPLHLYRPIEASHSYPVDALGAILGTAARCMHDIIRAPLEICGQSVLAAASLLTQGHANVKLDGRVIALSLFQISIAFSGERKSVVDDVALAAIYKYQEMQCKAYREEMTIYARQKDVWETGHKKWKNELKDNPSIPFVEEGPCAPLKPPIIIEEPTYEGLVKQLAEGQPSVGIFSDEGGRLVGGSAMSVDNRLKTLSGFSSLWDAKQSKPITRVRGGDECPPLYGRRVAMHLLMQDSVYALLTKSGLCESQGYLNRCLTVFPDSMAGQRPYVPRDVTQDPEIKHYWDRCNTLLDSPFPVAEGSQFKNELEIPNIDVDNKGYNLWVRFHDHTDRDVKIHGVYHSIKGFGSKAPEHALRIAGVLAKFEDPESLQVSAEHVERGIALTEYFLKERLRLESFAEIDSNLLLAEELLNWAKEKGENAVLLSQVYQFGPVNLRTKDKAEEILKILENHNRAIPVPASTIKPGARKTGWRFVWP